MHRPHRQSVGAIFTDGCMARSPQTERKRGLHRQIMYRFRRRDTGFSAPGGNGHGYSLGDNGFVAFEGGRKAGAADVAHLPADFSNGFSGGLQEAFCQINPRFMDIIHQLDTGAAFEHMGEIGWTDAETVADHGGAEGGVSGLRMDIFGDLGNVLADVEPEGVVVIVQIPEKFVDQGSPFRNTLCVFDLRRIAVYFCAFGAAGIAWNVQNNQNPFDTNGPSGAGRTASDAGWTVHIE